MLKILKNKFVILVGILCVGICIFVTWFIPPKLSDVQLPLSQNASFYTSLQQKLEVSQEMQEHLKKKYLEIWFEPWRGMHINPNVNEVFWAASGLLSGEKNYGANLKAYSQDFLQQLYDSMDMQHYPSVEIKAMITEDTAVRAVPTHLPRYNSPDNYPFDRWQNSLIFRGTPVLITHFNTTKNWAHIQSSFVSGWVRVEHLARVTTEEEKLFLENQNYVVPNKDQIPIYDSGENFLMMARMGQILELKKEEKKYFKILVPLRRSNGTLKVESALVLKDDFSFFPRKLDALNVASIVNSMMGQFYGWGGSLGSRDCSAFVRDTFANFGIYLPRNSAAQAKYAENMVDLSAMNAKEKEKYIIKNATPFATILWLRGHIMLYLGTYEDRAIVAHSAWSVMTRKMFSREENLLGGVVITTLTPANENNGLVFKSKTLLDRIMGMSDLYAYLLKAPIDQE